MEYRRQRRRRLDEKVLQQQEEEELVNEVLRDFPPEERGEREEWKEHVGWHRQENIRKGIVDHEENNDNIQASSGIGKDGTAAQRSSLRQNQEVSLGAMQNPTHPAFMVVSILLVFGFIVSNFLCKRSKQRTL